MINTSNLPVEALEVEYLLTVLRYELVDGSGGGMGCGGCTVPKRNVICGSTVRAY
jgi:N-methylhydantoinase B/oxoprolinase/acetone carboxylase alpha subunit